MKYPKYFIACNKVSLVVRVFLAGLESQGVVVLFAKF